MNETMSAIAERTKLYWKSRLYCYMEYYGYNYIRKMPQFVTTANSRKKSSVDLIQKNVMNSDFLSILYSKPLREYRKPKFKIRDKVCISKYDLLLRKR